MNRKFLTFCLVILSACGGGGPKEKPVPLVTTVVEYPTCFVLSFGVKPAAKGQKTPLAHDATIKGLKLRLPSGDAVDVMEQQFFWKEGGGELMVRLGKVPADTTSLRAKGMFQAFDSSGRPIGVVQELPANIDVSAPSVLDYKLAVSLAPTDESTSMWLDIDAMLSRPLHASGLPGARIERLQLEGTSGVLEVLGNQTFIPTAAGGKIRVKVPTLSLGERIKLKGWWVPLRTDNTPCCGEQPLPPFVEVASKDIQQERSMP